MENISIPPFYVGQEVISIWNHSQGAFKVGDEFRVTSIRKGCCQWLITIGIVSRGGLWECNVCRAEYHLQFNDEWEFHAKRFRPKIEIAEFISMKQLADQQLEIIGVN